MEIFIIIAVIVLFTIGYKILKPIEKQREILAEQIEQQQTEKISTNNNENKKDIQMITDNTVQEIHQLENNCISKSKKAKNYKVASIIGVILGLVCAVIGIWVEDNFWTPFWLSFGGGLWLVSFILEILAIFLSQLCDMQKLQILSFKTIHNIKDQTVNTNALKSKVEHVEENKGFGYIGGIKLENYEDDKD